MADLYLKSLQSERKALWATCRLKGLAKDTPERQRIIQIDDAIAAHAARAGAGKAKPKAAKPKASGGSSKGKAPKG
ncbi:hypothetical protein [Qipengyuania marisflavi]|uniref:Uncharacterized protein n=1 Tax=Qipengyuania marisflavi TaxID=2486356 RepID=A0A5S3P1L4_9SPHN|nr:hypothetical protein [Qipengyuania marisflavi]TMM46727.1 hypothetical protein FEV51_10870 [Qipengyuania marisflavi]